MAPCPPTARVARTALLLGLVIVGASHVAAELPEGFRDDRRIAIFAGGACVVETDGRVACWGRFEELPRDARYHVTGVRNAVALVSDGTDACAVTAEGVLACFGASVIALHQRNIEYEMRGEYRRCGEPDDEAFSSCYRRVDAIVRERQLDATLDVVWVTRDVVDASMSLGHVCAAKRDGRVACAELPADGAPPRSYDPPWDTSTLGRARRLCVATDETFVVNDRGELIELGHATHRSPPRIIAGLRDVVDVACGLTACALHANGGVSCAAESTWLDVGDEEPEIEFVTLPGFSEVRRLVAADEGLCATMRDGSVRCLGTAAAELARDTRSDATRPRTITAWQGATSLALGARQSCALLADGRVRCTGDGAGGLLGPAVFPPGDAFAPVLVGERALGGALDVTLVDEHVCFATSDRGVLCTSRELDAAGALRWVADTDPGNGARTGFHCVLRGSVASCAGPLGQLQVRNVRRIRTDGMGDTCAILRNGRLRCFTRWGHDIPTGSIRARVRDVSPGFYPCVLTERDEVLCQGDGAGVTRIPTLSGRRARSIVRSGTTVCVNRDDGVLCAERGARTGAAPYATDAPLPDGATVVAVPEHLAHGCHLLASSELRCTIRGSLVTLPDVATFATSESTVCAVTRAGAAFCAGPGLSYAIGGTPRFLVREPVDVPHDATSTSARPDVRTRPRGP